VVIIKFDYVNKERRSEFLMSLSCIQDSEGEIPSDSPAFVQQSALFSFRVTGAFRRWFLPVLFSTIYHVFLGAAFFMYQYGSIFPMLYCLFHSLVYVACLFYTHSLNRKASCPAYWFANANISGASSIKICVNNAWLFSDCTRVETIQPLRKLRMNSQTNC
jgi:hypothetical protein